MQIASGVEDKASQAGKRSKGIHTDLNNGVSVTTLSARRRSRLRTKSKRFYSFDNHCELDHTYAAVSAKSKSVSSLPRRKNKSKKIILIDDSADRKDYWLHELRLEPAKQSKSNVDDDSDSSLHFFQNQDRSLKQYRKAEKKFKQTESTPKSSTKSDSVDSSQKDNDRWIAAVALVELSNWNRSR